MKRTFRLFATLAATLALCLYAGTLLAATPKDIDLNKIYGLKVIPPLPVMDMVSKKAELKTKI